jgi:amidophosphoribosyltransferase
MPGQQQRKKSVKQKLNPIKLEFKNKNVLIVDDSIVRGNTSKKIIQLARDAGASKVYFASAAPPIINPDVYGVDIPTRTELIAHKRTIEQIRKEIGADKLFYQKIEDLVAAAKEGSDQVTGFHTGCFDGGYPTPEVTEELLQQMQKENSGRDDDHGSAQKISSDDDK